MAHFLLKYTPLKIIFHLFLYTYRIRCFFIRTFAADFEIYKMFNF